MSEVEHDAAAERGDLEEIIEGLRSDETALKVLLALAGAALLAPFSHRWAIAGLVGGPLLGDAVAVYVRRHEWRARRIWKASGVLALLLWTESAWAAMFGRGRRHRPIHRSAHLALSAFAATAALALIAGADIAMGHSLVGGHRNGSPRSHTTPGSSPHVTTSHGHHDSHGGTGGGGTGGPGGGGGSTGGGGGSTGGGGGSSGGGSSGGAPPLRLGQVSSKTPTNTFPMLSWDLLSGATTYAVSRLDTATGITKTYAAVTMGSFTDTALKPGGAYDATYTYTVTPIAAGGEKGAPASATVDYDTVAPTVPASVGWAAAPTGTCAAGLKPETLVWTGAADTDHYVVTVAKQSQDVTGTSMDMCWDTAASRSFSATVLAVDAAGNESAAAASPTLIG